MAEDRPHAVQWEDIHRPDVAAHLVGQTGQAPQRAATKLERGMPTSGTSESHAAKVGVKLDTLDAVHPYLREAKVTLQTAANRRESMYNHAEVNEHGDPEGSGWYFQHHGDIAASAAHHGYDTQTAITASAVMSPQNSPDNEKASVNALMDVHRNHTVKITRELASAVNKRIKGAPKLGKAHIGKDIAFSDLHPEHIAALSSGDFRDKDKAESKIKIRTSAGENTTRLLTDISRGGTKENIGKAIGVLRGTTDRSNAIDPQSSPKVWSYHNAIQNAVPNSAEHIEYMSRVGMVHGHGQQAIDYGMRHATHGILDPQGHTAEDTWMNAITSGQRLKGVPVPGRNKPSSPAKVYGSETNLGYIGSKQSDAGEFGDKKVSAHVGPQNAAAVQHAFNNKTTRKAGEQLTRKSGMEGAGLPAVAVQEVSWTHARRLAGGDKEYNERTSQGSAASHLGGQFNAHLKGQGTLF